MSDRQLIEDLLSALEYHTEQTRPIEFSKVAIEAAREHLQKPPQRTWVDFWEGYVPEPVKPAQQEPVAYLCENAVGHKYFRWKKPSSTYKPIALYASPPAQRTWEEWFKWWRTSKVADSTEAEIDFADFMLIVRAVESEYGIKEKNT